MVHLIRMIDNFTTGCASIISAFLNGHKKQIQSVNRLYNIFVVTTVKKKKIPHDEV